MLPTVGHHGRKSQRIAAMKIRKTSNHGKTRWRVAFVELGKERRRFFESRQAAEAFAAHREAQREEFGTAWLSTTAVERREAMEAIAQARAGGYSLADACRAFEATRRTAGASKPLSELQRLFLDAKRAQGLRARSIVEVGHSSQELHASYRDLMTRAEAQAIFDVVPVGSVRPIPKEIR